MGYTHYWTQKRSFTKEEWATFVEDANLLFAHAAAVGIPLGDGFGEVGSVPAWNDDEEGVALYFNGVGEDDSHETMVVKKIRPKGKTDYGSSKAWSFCKTAEKPYDVVVTAMLCYLDTIVGTHETTSDGDAKDWLAGLQFARAAMPKYANQIDIPMEILKASRWCRGPSGWVRHETNKYRFDFCVNGKAYIYPVKETGTAYVFASHEEADRFYQRNLDILSPSGYFNEKRIKSIKNCQTRKFGEMIRMAEAVGRAGPMPAYVRP